MTAKEQADALVEKFGNKLFSDDEEQTSATACAIIHVELLLELLYRLIMLAKE